MRINLTSISTVAVGASSGAFATTLMEGATYVVISTVAAWLAVGSSPSATKEGATMLLIPPNFPVRFLAPAGATNTAAIIEDSSGGYATLALCE